MTAAARKLIRYLKRLGATAMYLLFPPICPVCGDVSGKRRIGEPCPECLSRLTDDMCTVCPQCGQAPRDCVCAPEFCSEFEVSPFTAVHPLIFCAFYEGYDEDSAVSSLVYHTKRAADSSGAVFLARMISAEILRRAATDHFDVRDCTVTYIPRSAAALRKYGFDHMGLCAKRCAKLIGCRYCAMFVRRGGTDQKTLGALERQRNAESTLSLRKSAATDAAGARVIVIDDMITTGATMRAAVSALSFAGAAEIIPVAAFLTSKNKQRQK